VSIPVVRRNEPLIYHVNANQGNGFRRQYEIREHI
jgi:hypothetical protein